MEYSSASARPRTQSICRSCESLQTDASLSNQALADRGRTCRRRPACAGCKRLVDAGVDRAPGGDRCRRSALGHGLTAIVEVTLDRQGAEHSPRSRRAPSPRPRCSSATASRPAPTSCWSSRSPTWRPTTRWCSACSRRTPTCATSRLLQRAPAPSSRPRIALPAACAAQRLRITRPFRYSPSGKSIVIGWSGAAPSRA